MLPIGIENNFKGHNIEKPPILKYGNVLVFISMGKREMAALLCLSS